MVSIVITAATAAEPSTLPGDQWDVSPPLPLWEGANVMPNSPALLKSVGDPAEYVLRRRPPANFESWSKRGHPNRA
ncbi:MAG: hypothetical protein L0Z50_24545 [Verrucomicrobiales bacterium]|nr:hypothetical protein [Verrucomicrobiales bacterium]